MAKLFLDSNETYGGTIGSNTSVYGDGTGTETATIAAGATGVVFDQNVEKVVLSGNVSDYKYQQQGNQLVIYSGADVVATTTLQTDDNGTLIKFGNGSVVSAAMVTSPSGPPTVALGGATVPAGTTAAEAAVVEPTIVISEDPLPQVATLTAGAAAVNEGAAAVFTLAHGAANATYTYNIAGVEAADVTGGLLTGTVTTDANGAATISVATVADRLTEGAQTITVSLPNTSLTASTTLNDTSLNNNAPVATAATGAVAEAAILTGQLAATDADADAITFALDAPVEGLTINADGSYTFDAALNTTAQALTYNSAPAVINAAYTVTDALGATSSSTLAITVTPTPLTISLNASAAFVEEGATVQYTLVASEAVAAATTGTIQVVAGDGTTGQTAANDFGSGSLNPVTVTIAAGATTSTAMTLTPANDAATEMPEAYTVKGTVTGYTIADVAGEVRDPSTVGGLGQTFNLTTGIDTIPGLVGSAGSTGTDGDDTFVALLDSVTAANTTLNGLDQINGGLGNNSMTLNANGAAAAFPSTATISNVQTMTLRGTANLGTVGVNDVVNDGTGGDDDATPTAAFDVSNITGLTTLNVTLATSTSVKAATTTDVAISGVTGGIEVNGGKTVTVTDASANNHITVGSTVVAAANDTNTAGTAAAGAITVTDTKQGTGLIQIDGGTSVNVTTTIDATTDPVDGGDIVIGRATQASGAVTVVQNLNSTGGDADADDLTAADITVTGGSSISITVNATSTATAAGADGDIAVGAITVVGDSKTTEVTVTQNASTTTFTTPVVAETGATQTVTFKALAAGETTTLGHGAQNLTFTAAKALTAEEVAQAFADLTNSDRQDNGGPTANGTYSGQFAAAWASTSVSGATVTFTATNDDTTTLVAAGAVAPTLGTLVAGVNGSGGVATTNMVSYGAVRVDDNATEAITTVTVNGYASADLGKTGVDLDALTTLSLANSAGVANVATDSASLALTVNSVNHAVNLDETAATIKTLNVTATGANSTFGLTAAAVEALTVAGDKVLDIDTASTLTALKTVTVSGSAGLSIAAGTLANVTSIDTTGTTGAVTATLDGSKATYTGGAGVDTVTLTAATVAKNITLGGGDDKLDGSVATLTGTFTFDGGTGTNTLVLGAAQADGLDNDATFEGKISNFQKLSLGTVANDVQNTVNLANMDDINYVITAGSVDTAYVVDTTITGSTDNAADTVTIVVDGVTYTSAAGIYANGAAIATALITAINAGTGAVTASSGGAGIITLTADNPGQTFTVGAIAGVTGGGAGDTVTKVDAVTSSQLTLTNMTDAGTVELTAAGVDTVVVMTDATGTADSLNILTTDLATVNVGTVTANGVETIKVTTTDTFVDANADGLDDANSVATLAVKSDKVANVNVTGAGDITLVATDSTLDEVDASTLSGVLTFTAAVNDLVVKGGTAGDALTAAANDVALYGNAGADTLTVASGLRVNLYGGDGADTFVINTGASATLDAYTVINGVATGDTLKLTGADSFSSTKIALSVGADETLLNYANQATKVLGEDDMGWFQKGGNTYIVMDTDNTDGDAFVAGTDMIVMITGLVDLSTASYNATSNILEIA